MDAQAQLEREKMAQQAQLEREKMALDDRHKNEDRRAKSNESLVSAGLPPDYSFEDDRAQFAAIMDVVSQNSEAMQAMIQAVAAGQMKLGEGQEALALSIQDMAQAERAPKRVLRDGEGRVVGVEVAQ